MSGGYRPCHRRSPEDNTVDGFKVLSSVPLSADTSDSDVSGITDLASLSLHLPKICGTIFEQIGSQQTEGTYQRCLKIDLEQAGCTVLLEPEILLTYKTKVVGTRRADVLVVLYSGEKAILELKAVDTMKRTHMKQLEYYLHHSDVSKGYLINFPHDDSFQDVSHKSAFVSKILKGIQDMLGPTLRTRNDPSKRDVDVVEVTRRHLTAQEQQSRTTEREPEPRVFCLKKNGEPCKHGERKGWFCGMHKNQIPAH